MSAGATPAARPKVDWPTAAVIITGFATVIGLVLLEQSLIAIGVFIGSLATTYQAWRSSVSGKAVEEVKSLANGNNEALRLQLAEQSAAMLALSKDHYNIVAQLAAGLPPGTPLPKQLTEGNAGHIP